jgi:hypothetical protein
MRTLTLLYILSSFHRGFGIYQALRGFPDPARAWKGPASLWLARHVSCVSYQLGLVAIPVGVRRDDGWGGDTKREVLTSVTAVFEPHRSRETHFQLALRDFWESGASVRLFLGSTGTEYVTRDSNQRGTAYPIVAEDVLLANRLTPARPQSGKRKLQAQVGS